MLFNSVDFAVFLPAIFALYWAVGKENRKGQNLVLIIGSYLFYGWWDWRFLLLIFASSALDFYLGLKLGSTTSQKSRKLLLASSLIFNLGLLGFFKYANFFLESFTETFTFFGSRFETDRLDIILPVGISFYTFQTLSYTIDVYRKKLKPTSDPVLFFTFVAFFPQLVAGPIERASNLLPQFQSKRNFDYHQGADGLRQILWGLFKKIVIADNFGRHVDFIFTDYEQYPGGVLVLGAVFFAFQIYCDFSGYSDIAIGTARLFGFNLMRNFAFPYFSRDIAEFWRRWHISLSTWFRDYLYIPLGGSRVSEFLSVRNTFVVFLVSGFWHGANWTFLFWGFLHALFFLPLLLTGRNRSHLDTISRGKLWVSGSELLKMISTFSLVTLGWIFFRADSIEHGFQFISHLFTNISEPINRASLSFTNLFIIGDLLMLILFIIVEWIRREQAHPLYFSANGGNRMKRWFLYVGVIFLIVLYGQTEELPFIYFQF